MAYPNVNLGPIILLPFEELWSGIGRTPTPRFQQLTRREDVTEPKI